jgi:hypothetical protein
VIDLHVDRLTLRLTGISAGDGRRLAQLVAECLAAADTPGSTVTADRLRVGVTASPGEPLESTARRIAAAVVRALGRSS